MKIVKIELSRLFIVIILMAGFTGCATISMIEASKGRTQIEKSLVLSDEVVAIGKADTALKQQLGKNVIAFLGKKHTYLLHKGGEHLEHIASSGLNPRYIRLQGNKQLLLKDQRLWGHVNLYYDKTELSPAELHTLQRLKFRLKNKIYHRAVPVAGQVAAPISLTQSQHQFTKSFNIEFYQTENSRVPNYALVPLIPFAIAADVVLAPVYLGVVLILISN